MVRCVLFLGFVFSACGSSGAKTTVDVSGPSRSFPVSERELGVPSRAIGDFAPYLNHIHERVAPSWSGFLELASSNQVKKDEPIRGPHLECVWSIAITADGNVREYRLRKSSGVERFDAVAKGILMDAAPFDPPPEKTSSDDGTTYIDWLFAADKRQAGGLYAKVVKRKWHGEEAVQILLRRGLVKKAAERLHEELTARTLGAKEGQAWTGRFIEGFVKMGLSGEHPEHVDEALKVAAGGDFGDSEIQEKISRFLDANGVRGRLAWRAVRGGKIDALSRAWAKEGDEGKRDAIVYAMARGDAKEVQKVVSKFLRSKNTEEVNIGLKVTSHVGVAGTAPLLDAILKQRTTSRPQRMAACSSLGKLLPVQGAYQGIRRGMASKDAYVRAECAAAVAQAETVKPDIPAYYAALRLIGDRDNTVRRAAVVAAARLGPSKYTKDLGRTRGEKEPEVLAAIAESLLFVGPNKQGLRRLRRLVKHKTPSVRAAAVRSLARLAPEEVRKMELEDAHPSVKAAAVGIENDDELARQAIRKLPPEFQLNASKAFVKQFGRASASKLFTSHFADSARSQWMLLWLDNGGTGCGVTKWCDEGPS